MNTATGTLHQVGPRGGRARSTEAVLHCTDGQVETARVAETWTTSTCSDPSWGAAVVAALGHDRAFGALSFEPDGLGAMHRLAERRRRPADEAVHRASALLSAAGATASRRHEVRAVPAPHEYAERVRLALDHIEAGQVDKVVLGRHLEVRSTPALQADEVVARLLVTRPGPYVFRLPVPDAGGGATLLGASPELLVRRTGSLVESTPLAGSVPRSDDPEEDRRRHVALRSSAKDQHEHQFVVQDIVARLRAAGVHVQEPGDPVVIGTDTLWHLATPIRGTVGPDGPSALTLAQTLHPTPAVGGSPAVDALALVARLEGRPRGWMAGAVGWVDGDGDGEFALTLRSGLLRDDHLRLFAGAGIVAGSVPEDEVRETGAKLGTMARAVGL